jgi:shikimate kinase
MGTVLVVGMMGAGKSAVGAALARALGLPHLDNDLLVEELTGRSKASLLRAEGEPALRSAERAALLAVLGRDRPAVAGVAAGALLADDVLAAVLARRREGAVAVVWLDAPLAELARRVRADPADRPWLDGDLDAALQALDEPRRRAFTQVADVRVETAGRDVDDVVDEVRRRLVELRS